MIRSQPPPDRPMSRPITLRAAAGGLFTVVRWLVVLAFAIMVAAAIAQVISRYVVNRPLGWTEELARILMVWWTFAAVAVLAFRRKLLAVDAVLLAASARVRLLLITLADGLGLVFVGWLAYLAWRLVALAGTQVSPALEIPQAWIYMGVALGLSAAACGFATNMLADFRRLRLGAGAEAIKASERSDL